MVNYGIHYIFSATELASSLFTVILLFFLDRFAGPEKIIIAIARIQEIRSSVIDAMGAKKNVVAAIQK